jgi:hypothetical protein
VTQDEYRQRAIHAERRAEGASIPEVKRFYHDVACYWRTLADAAVLLEKRYGAPVSAEFFQTQSGRPTLQQQQQEQPQQQQQQEQPQKD